MCGLWTSLWEIHYSCQKKCTSWQWVKNGVSGDHEVQHIFLQHYHHVVQVPATLQCATLNLTTWGNAIPPFWNAFLKSSVEVWEPYREDMKGGIQCVVEVPGAIGIYWTLLLLFSQYWFKIDYCISLFYNAMQTVTQCKVIFCLTLTVMWIIICPKNLMLWLL
jgi:hypothetical protein